MRRTALRRPPWLRPLLLGGPLALLFLLLLVYPVGQLLLLSVYSDGAFTLAPYRQLFASSVYVNVMLITLKISVCTTVLSVIAGYPVAYLIASLPRQHKSAWLFWVLLSFWTSFLVRAFAWIVMLGRNGVINQWLTATGLQDAPANLLYSLGAVLVSMVHALMPLGVLTGVFCALDARRCGGRHHGVRHGDRLFHRPGPARRPQGNHDHPIDHRAGSADHELGLCRRDFGADADRRAGCVRGVRQAVGPVDDGRHESGAWPARQPQRAAAPQGPSAAGRAGQRQRQVAGAVFQGRVQHRAQYRAHYRAQHRTRPLAADARLRGAGAAVPERARVADDPAVRGRQVGVELAAQGVLAGVLPGTAGRAAVAAGRAALADRRPGSVCPRAADRHAGGLAAGALDHARQVAVAGLCAVSDHRAAHDHRGGPVLFLRQGRSGR